MYIHNDDALFSIQIILKCNMSEYFEPYCTNIRTQSVIKKPFVCDFGCDGGGVTISILKDHECFHHIPFKA